MFTAACRLILYSSLVYDAVNNIVLELYTPSGNANGIVFCFNNTVVNVTASNAGVLSLKEGGHQWNTTEQELIHNNASLSSNPFFAVEQNARLPLVWAGSLADILVFDAYYNSSYVSSWLDDLRISDQLSTMQSIISTSSCIAISGQWKATTRYQVTLHVKNPAPPSSSKPLPAPVVWMAPFTYAKGATQQQPALSIRGSKYGTLCSPRPALAAVSTRMVDACSEARSRRLVQAQEGNVKLCTEALQAASGAPGNINTFPFTVPPFAALSVAQLAQASCPAGQLMSPRYQECVDCSHADISARNCTCQAPYTTNMIGTSACGAKYSADGSASSISDVAKQLCSTFTGMYQHIMQGQFSDRAVNKLLLQAMMQAGASLLDLTDLQTANETFRRGFSVDHRRPDSPTRKHGIKPNCNRCYDGRFIDLYTGQQVDAYDDRFGAVHTFRLVGYVLHQKGFPCTALWDAQQPLENKYGVYSQTICAPLPSQS